MSGSEESEFVLAIKGTVILIIVIVVIVYTVRFVKSVKEWWRGGEFETIAFVEEAYACAEASTLKKYNMDVNDISPKNYKSGHRESTSTGALGSLISYTKTNPFKYYQIENVKRIVRNSEGEIVKTTKEAVSIRSLSNITFALFNDNLLWNKPQKKRDAEAWDYFTGPDYFINITPDSYEAVYCDNRGGFVTNDHYAMDMDVDECEVEVFYGDFKAKFLSYIERNNSLCKTIDNPSIYTRTIKTAFKGNQKMDERMQDLANDPNSNINKVNKDYQKWKDNN